MVPIALMHKRVKSPVFGHGTLVQRIGHVDKGIVRAWAYLFDPMAVDILNTATCTEYVMLHELSALSL